MAQNLEEARQLPSKLKSLRRERLKISNACQPCRQRKVKCDGRLPACAGCQERRKTCTYGQDFTAAAQQPKRTKPARTHPVRSHRPASASASSLVRPAQSILIPVTPTTTETSSTVAATPTWEHVDEGRNLDTGPGADTDPDADPGRTYYTAHGRFAGDVAAAIDLRAGLPSATTTKLVPFVDAPLFGELDLQSPRTPLDSAYELPPRAYADRLVGIYWQYIDPVEPVLDRARFSHDYEASYSKTVTATREDGDVWLSILNTVFALATQRQESICTQQRNDEANRFFKRAWALLDPEAILWKPGSLGLVQCLMLLNRYLHCTNNQQKTWMTAGLAMRMAQNLCLHTTETAPTKESNSDRKLQQHIWASCVALDRTSTPILIPVPERTNHVYSSQSFQKGEGNSERFMLALELHEIGTQIQLAQVQTRNHLATKLGLPRLYQQEEYQAVAMQLDNCLNKWEDSLPAKWKLESLQRAVDKAFRADGYLLHLRPMLARLYSTKAHKMTPQATYGLSDRLLREFAGLCVETAQKITSLIADTLEPYEPMGLLPWWYRIYYLHIAGANFLAAMLAPDLFTKSVSQSWHTVINTLHAHTHLSPYVHQCIHTFETLSAKILATQNPQSATCGVFPIEEDTSAFCLDYCFQDFGFDLDSFQFGTEDQI